MSLHHREKHGTLKLSKKALSTPLTSSSCKRVFLYIVLVCFCEARGDGEWRRPCRVQLSAHKFFHTQQRPMDFRIAAKEVVLPAARALADCDLALLGEHFRAKPVQAGSRSRETVFAQSRAGSKRLRDALRRIPSLLASSKRATFSSRTVTRWYSRPLARPIEILSLR